MIRTVLFDLDGTILDTNELIIQSFLHALEGVTPEPVTREQIISNMGGALVDQMKFFSGREDVDDLVQKYRAYNISKHDELVKGFPYGNALGRPSTWGGHKQSAHDNRDGP